MPIEVDVDRVYYVYYTLQFAPGSAGSLYPGETMVRGSNGFSVVNMALATIWSIFIAGMVTSIHHERSIRV
jgi:hypothetical protein